VRQRRAVAHEQRPELDGLVEPLVRVEGDRVGELQTLERPAASFAETGERAVGTVDVEPEVVVAADLRQVAERVDGACRRRAGVRDDQQWQPPGGLVGADSAEERLRAHPGAFVGRDDAHLVGPEPERPRGACQRRVRLVGHVDDRPLVHRAESRLPRARERRQVGGRAARHEHADRLLGVADPLPQPVEDDELERARPGGPEPPARVDVERTRDQVAERAGPGAFARNEAEIAGVADPGDKGQHVSLQPFEHLVERRWLLRRRHAQAAQQLLGAGRPHDRPRWPDDPVDEHVDGPVPDAAHRLRVERERRSFPGSHPARLHYRIRPGTPCRPDRGARRLVGQPRSASAAPKVTAAYVEVVAVPASAAR
jgi:hypothetical protein